LGCNFPLYCQMCWFLVQSLYTEIIFLAVPAVWGRLWLNEPEARSSATPEVDHVCLRDSTTAFVDVIHLNWTLKNSEYKVNFNRALLTNRHNGSCLQGPGFFFLRDLKWSWSKKISKTNYVIYLVLLLSYCKTLTDTISSSANSSHNQESFQQLHAPTKTQCFVSDQHWFWIAGQYWFSWYCWKLRFWEFRKNCFWLRVVQLLITSQP